MRLPQVDQMGRPFIQSEFRGYGAPYLDPMTSARPCRLCGALVADDQHMDHLRWHASVDPELEEPTSVHGIWTRDGEWIEL